MGENMSEVAVGGGGGLKTVHRKSEFLGFQNFFNRVP